MKFNDLSFTFHTDKITECVDFYSKYFQATMTFDAGWYIVICLPSGKTPLLLSFQGNTEDMKSELFAGGVTLNLLVDDVDSLYERLKQDGLSFVEEIADHEWGDRAFSLYDPIGNLIYIYSARELHEKYKDAVKENEYLAVYKEILQKGIVQKAYRDLQKSVTGLKAFLEKGALSEYSLGNVSPGYMDFTYFPFSNDFLRERKLRFGIVLNHEKLRFELWLMGQNAAIQKEYWEVLKHSEWNKQQPAMPQYSVLEVVLTEKPNFANPDELNRDIEKKLLLLVQEIVDYIQAGK